MSKKFVKNISISSYSVYSNSSNSAKSVKYKYRFYLHAVKYQNSSIWTIQYSASRVSMSKTVQFQTIQFSTSAQFKCTFILSQKYFYFKLISLVKQF